MPSMKNKEHEKGVQAQVNEDDLRKTNKRLVKKIVALEEEIKLAEKNQEFWWGTAEELRKRADSYKAQLIVYKGIVNEFLLKLVEKK